MSDLQYWLPIISIVSTIVAIGIAAGIQRQSTKQNSRDIKRLQDSVTIIRETQLSQISLVDDVKELKRSIEKIADIQIVLAEVRKDIEIMKEAYKDIKKK